MALRSEAFFALCLSMGAAFGQTVEIPARRDGLLRDRPAVVTVDDKGIAGLAWDDIQQLTLDGDELRILTYTDSDWRGGRDRQIAYQGLPAGTAEKLLPLFRERLGSRLVSRVAVTPAKVLWEVPVKLHRGLGGSEGALQVGQDEIVYRSGERDQSRTWRISEIDAVSSAGAYDLTITTSERAGLLRSGPTDFRFQLKRPMPEHRYQELWRRVVGGRGLAILQSSKE